MVANKIYSSAIHCFRRDLRLNDNPSLNYASLHSDKLTLVFLHDKNPEITFGGASKWWLHHSLESLRKDLDDQGQQLVIRQGGSILSVLKEIISEVEATLVCWNRRYEPFSIKEDTKIKENLTDLGIKVKTFNSSLLKEPWEIQNSSKKPYQVFSPFFRTLEKEVRSELPNEIKQLKFTNFQKSKIRSVTIDDLNLLPKINWDKEFYTTWKVGEKHALSKLDSFIKLNLKDYTKKRDYPFLEGSSKLSPHLHFGEIGPRQIWAQLNEKHILYNDSRPFLRQLGWREFSYHLLFHFPETVKEPLKKEFKNFPWAKNKKFLTAWQKGRTGYPIVDAGMRELRRTGFMHNRVRMLVGSLLVKNCLINWKEGVSWFADNLVDADLANNIMGWQWVQGSGADASPYFRIFNPVTQSEKFDPEGIYIKKWLPELSNLGKKWIHKPWLAPVNDLLESGITLGENYPKPIINLKETREIALEAYYSIRKK